MKEPFVKWIPFYKALGFVSTDEEKTVNGIRFTPMRFESR